MRLLLYCKFCSFHRSGTPQPANKNALSPFQRDKALNTLRYHSSCRTKRPATQAMPGNGGGRRGLLLFSPLLRGDILRPFPPPCTTRQLSEGSGTNTCPHPRILRYYRSILSAFSPSVKGERPDFRRKPGRSSRFLYTYPYIPRTETSPADRACRVPSGNSTTRRNWSSISTA